MGSIHRNLVATTAVLLLTTAPIGAAYADPPPWAPAHGWRAKHDRDDRHRHRGRGVDSFPNRRQVRG